MFSSSSGILFPYIRTNSCCMGYPSSSFACEIVRNMAHYTLSLHDYRLASWHTPNFELSPYVYSFVYLQISRFFHRRLMCSAAGNFLLVTRIHNYPYTQPDPSRCRCGCPRSDHICLCSVGTAPNGCSGLSSTALHTHWIYQWLTLAFAAFFPLSASGNFCGLPHCLPHRPLCSSVFLIAYYPKLAAADIFLRILPPSTMVGTPLASYWHTAT